MAEDRDRYLAVEDGEEVEIRVRGSRFLGRVFRADDEAAAVGHLEEVRRLHHAATHHCWARRLGSPEAVAERADDDGEPAGTAGRPILESLTREGLHRVLLVVTRYFGGTKLGTGGLARAYAEAAVAALAVAPRREVWREQVLTVAVAYGDVGAVEAVLAREESRLRGVERDFGGSPRFLLTVPASAAAELATVLIEATSGRAAVHTAEPSP